MGNLHGKRSPLLGAVVASFLSAVALGCASENTESSANNPPQIAPLSIAELAKELTDLGVDKHLGNIAPVSTATHTGDWTSYHYGTSATAQAKCFDGSEYVASVRDGDANQIVLNLGGGGACWSYESCFVLPGFVKKESKPLVGEKGGLANRNHADNPIADWAMVYGDYCDGSVWSGDRTVVHKEASSGVTRAAEHYGLRNLSATVTLMHQLYPNPERIVVTGASAGGYGTMMGYLVTRAQYPGVPIRLLNDSGPWLYNPDFPDIGADSVERWGVNDFIPDDCPERCNEQLIYLLEYLFPRDPLVDVALFMHYNDFTIGASYLAYGWDFSDVLVERTDVLANAHPDRFKRFFHDGVRHTIIWSDDLYTINNHGMLLHDWISAFVDDTPDWVDLP